MLIQLVCRKLKKGKTAAVIAEELEEDLTLIEKICSVVEQCGPDADLEKLYEVFEKE